VEKPHLWECLIDTEDLERDVRARYRFDLEFPGPVLFQGLAFTPSGPLVITAEAQRDPEAIAADIHISFSAEAPCSRCLRQTGIALEGRFRYFYILPPSGEQDGEPEEFTVFVDSLTAPLDISDQVWESLILLLPEKVLCSEECKGLCPVCGADLNLGDCGCTPDNVDPRLSILCDIDPQGEADDEQ